MFEEDMIRNRQLKASRDEEDMIRNRQLKFREDENDEKVLRQGTPKALLGILTNLFREKPVLPINLISYNMKNVVTCLIENPALQTSFMINLNSYLGSLLRQNLAFPDEFEHFFKDMFHEFARQKTTSVLEMYNYARRLVLDSRKSPVLFATSFQYGKNKQEDESQPDPLIHHIYHYLNIFSLLEKQMQDVALPENETRVTRPR